MQEPPGGSAGPVRKGDVLARVDGAASPERLRGVPAAPPVGAGSLEVRAIPGPHLPYFSKTGVETFFSSEYVLSPRSDRRGLRLDGPRVELTRSADLPPEGVAPGSVQIPGDGLPIVLGPDGPATGGYPRVATVIGTDLPLLAQARPGRRIRFARATLEEALEARRAR